jgi:biotin carboxyl carrier protein
MTDKQRRRELDRLADEVVPLLIARLADSRLGELEIRDGDWRVRVRRERGTRAQQAASQTAGSSGGSAAHARERHVARRDAASEPAPSGPRPRAAALPGRLGTPSGNGANAGLEAVGPGPAGDAVGGRGAHPDEPRRIVARAPAVGYYTPAHGLSTGKIVALDDVIGQIDVLGVRQAVVAPAAGIVSRLMAQAGEAVEYGQELLQIDVVPRGDVVARRRAPSDARPGSG